MTTLRMFLAVSLCVGLVGCKEDEMGGDGGPDLGDGGGDVGFDPETDISVDWDETEYIMTVTLTNTDATGFYFGMAETGAPASPWYREDCLEGTEDSGCHEVTGTTLELVSETDIANVTYTGESQGTLFNEDDDVAENEEDTPDDADACNADGQHRLTYLLQIMGGADPGDATCYVWGDDTTYYTGNEETGNCIAITGPACDN